MHIFVLEDDPNRVARFKRELIGHAVEFTEHVSKANMLLDGEKFDLLFLDHDLGGEIFVDHTKEETGYHVAQHIPRTQNKNTPAVVHSCNMVGAKNMSNYLENCVCIPFFQLNFERILQWAAEQN